MVKWFLVIIKGVFMKYTYIILWGLSLTHVVIYQADFKLGLENIPGSFLQKLRLNNNALSRIGLITNQTGKDQQGRRNIDILLAYDLPITCIFAPEHGFSGVVLAGKEVNGSVDEKTNIPVVSLYGKGSGKRITKDTVSNIDVLMFDIQDSGMRHYTYISTLLRAMEAAAEFDKRIVVLDRPNPLGFRMEGPLVEKDLHSFISIASIPLRHGMTIGELAWYFNLYVLKAPAKLHVIKMKNYNRGVGLNNVLPEALSPNIQHIQSCYGYSFLGLLGEIAPFNVGVGTDMAFRCILLPRALAVKSSIWKQVQKLLASYGIKSSPHICLNYKGQHSGLSLRIDDINTVASFSLLLDLLQFFQNTGMRFSYSPMFNKAVGTKDVRKMMSGMFERVRLSHITQTNLQEFFNKARQVFMYEPLPHVGN